MSELKNELILEASGFNQTIDQATGKVEDFDKASKKAGDSIKDLGDKGTLSTKELLKEIGKMSGAERSVSNYRRQLMQMTKDISDLTIAYRNMNAEQQNSDVGRQTLQRIQELTNQAGQYKDAIMDVQQNIKNLASDTMYWDAAAQGVQMFTGAMQICSAVSLITGKNTDQLVKALAKVKALETSARAIKNITNALQKQSSLMSVITGLQRKLTLATNTQTAATGAATIAQKLFNKIANANPYILLASAAIAVGTALFAWSKHSKKAEEEQKKLDEETENAKKVTETYAGEIGTLLNKFLDLTDAYRRLSSNKDKLNFLKTHADDFKNLGLAVKDLNDAENIFINNTEKFKQAIIKRGVIQGLQKIIEQETNKAAEQIAALYQEGAGPYKQGQILTETQAGLAGHNRDYWTLGVSDRNMGQNYVTLNQEGADLLNKEYLAKKEEGLLKDLEGSRERIQGIIDRYTQEISGILDFNLGDSGSGGSGGGGIIDPKAVEGSLTWLQNEYSKELKTLQGMKIDDPGFDEQKDKVLALYKLIEDLKDKYQIGVKVETGEAEENIELVSGSLAEAQYHVNELTKVLQNMNPNDEDFEEIVELLEIWKKKLEEINKLINNTNDKVEETKGKYDDILETYSKLTSSARDIQQLFDIGAISSSDAKKMMDDINKQLAAAGLTIRVNLEIGGIDEFKNKFDKISGIVTGPIDAIESVGNSYRQMMDKLEDPKADGWEQFWSVISFGETVISAVSSVLGVMATIQDMVTAAKQRSTQATIQETAAEAVNITTKGEEAAANITLAGTEGAAAAAGAGQSVSSIPYVGPILAIAAIASVMAAIIGIIATAKGFTTGGIVGGNSFTGDKLWARLNSGEMVLNVDQQQNLWKQLNSGPVIADAASSSVNIPDKITLTAKGTDLQAVIYNNSKRNSKI